MLLTLLFSHFGLASTFAQGTGPRLPNGDFLHTPYLQIGQSEEVNSSLSLMFHVLPAEAEERWEVRYQSVRGMGSAELKKREIKTARPAFFSFEANLADLVPGATFGYEVLKNGKVIFTSIAKGPRLGAKRWRLAAVGDCGRGTQEQSQVAKQMNRVSPDLVLITGDIVYDKGLISEYETKFWSYYNANENTDRGVSMMRKVPFVPVPGNHDIGTTDLDRYPDALGYFLFYDVPRNGAVLGSQNPSNPIATGKNIEPFLASAGDAYPVTANYSFDYGNVHFTVLNSNPNVNWSDGALRNWLENDLRSARPDFWRIVTYHHPEFHSSQTHAGDKQMRAISDLLVKHKVDLVLTGHVHNYQRSKPIQESFKSLLSTSLAKNDWLVDRRFDGKNLTDTDGVIRIVTGAGGAPLYNTDSEMDRSKWLPFTEVYSAKFSFSQIDFDGDQLFFRQIATDGTLIDQFQLTKKPKS